MSCCLASQADTVHGGGEEPGGSPSSRPSCLTVPACSYSNSPKQPFLKSPPPLYIQPQMVTNRNTSSSRDKVFRGKCWSFRSREKNTKPTRRRQRLPQGRQGRGRPAALGLTPLLLPEACWHCPHGGLGKTGHPAPRLGSLALPSPEGMAPASPALIL